MLNVQHQGQSIKHHTQLQLQAPITTHTTKKRQGDHEGYVSVSGTCLKKGKAYTGKNELPRSKEATDGKQIPRLQSGSTPQSGAPSNSVVGKTNQECGD